MLATILHGPRDIRFEDRPEPAITEPTDAILRLAATCVCGSDLWPYRGIQKIKQPTPMGHEYCGVVEEIGREVKSIKPGQFVDVFASRGVQPDQLPPAHPTLLPLDEAAEQKRATQVASNFGTVTPGLVENTTNLLFRDLWLRPALAPRDRSLVTVSALIAAGQVAQIPYHLGRAMDNGLTAAEAGEMVTHLAFYAGWPNAFSAAPVIKDVLAQRAHAG